MAHFFGLAMKKNFLGSGSFSINDGLKIRWLGN
jgi:hypothetical protein